MRRGLGRRRSEGLVVDVLGILPGAFHVPALEYVGTSFDTAGQQLVSVKHCMGFVFTWQELALEPTTRGWREHSTASRSTAPARSK